MPEDKFHILRTTTPYHEEFHRSRIMFCIIGDEVKVGPIGTTESHLDWFKREGWIAETEENAEEFLNTHIRGFFLQSENGLYCYRGVGFGFDEDVISELKKYLPKLKEVFNLNNDTKICFGPKDSPLEGINWPRYYAGTLKELL
jgi:hypothetical protein